jgi:hypothetical protein
MDCLSVLRDWFKAAYEADLVFASRNGLDLAHAWELGWSYEAVNDYIDGLEEGDAAKILWRVARVWELVNHHPLVERYLTTQQAADAAKARAAKAAEDAPGGAAGPKEDAEDPNDPVGGSGPDPDDLFDSPLSLNDDAGESCMKWDFSEVEYRVSGGNGVTDGVC